MGYSMEAVAWFEAHHFTLHAAVLPHLPQTREAVRRLLAAGVEVLCHLPMQPEDYPEHDPGPGAITIGASEADVKRLAHEAFDDIPGLSEHLLTGFGYAHLPLTTEILQLLTNYPWPGNLRELKNMLERAVLLAQGKPLAPRHFPGLSGAPFTAMESVNLHNLDDIETAHILKTIREFNGDKYKSAEALGISLSTLYRKLNSAKKSSAAASAARA